MVVINGYDEDRWGYGDSGCGVGHQWWLHMVALMVISGGFT